MLALLTTVPPVWPFPVTVVLPPNRRPWWVGDFDVPSAIVGNSEDRVGVIAGQFDCGLYGGAGYDLHRAALGRMSHIRHVHRTGCAGDEGDISEVDELGRVLMAGAAEAGHPGRGSPTSDPLPVAVKSTVSVPPASNFTIPFWTTATPPLTFEVSVKSTVPLVNARNVPPELVTLLVKGR